MSLPVRVDVTTSSHDVQLRSSREGDSVDFLTLALARANTTYVAFLGAVLLNYGGNASRKSLH